jgi:uncharacterized protein YbaR (Trm112 family)
MGGAMRFSDGQCKGPKLPDFPDLTKCPKCNTIFWISDLKEIATVNLLKKTRIWKLASYVDFLPIDDLYKALEMFKEPGIERLIRTWIWWAFNDRIRNNKKLVRTNGLLVCTNDDLHYAVLEQPNMFVDGDEALWEKNCERLLKLLNAKNINQKIMMAELHRNLGRFTQCVKIIKSLPVDYEWIKARFNEQCERRNTFVFRLI